MRSPRSEKSGGDDRWRVLNGDSAVVSSRRSSRLSFSALLASQDRDFLLSPTGTQVKISELEDKVLGLYFSANWNPQCWNFTQILAGVFEELRTNHGNNGSGGFEVVFVSSDENSEAFDGYRACMPWLAIPFSDVETKKALNCRFDVEGIPCLVILQPSHGCAGGEEVAALKDGVEVVYRYGVAGFPFTAERVEELRREDAERHERQTLTSLLTNRDRDFLLANSAPEQVPVASLTGKTVGLYFSAQWCLPCVKFTPRLISIYHNIKQMLAQDPNEDFEIVFVSSDRDQMTFRSYFSFMPWLAIPFGDQNIKDLTKHFDVQGIPCLVILGPNSKTVTKQGRNLINLYREKAYPFTEAQLEVLERQMDEEAKALPRSQFHHGHRHELNLVSEGSGGGPFICCDCDEQGSGWAYQCIECGYEIHPKCVRPADRGSGAAR